MILWSDSKAIGIRLKASERYNQGQVEIYDGQNWGQICNTDWQFRDAQVACRQLGFANAQPRTQCCNAFNTSNVPVVVARIHCTGTEPNLANCPQSNLASDIAQCSSAGASVYCVGKFKLELLMLLSIYSLL